MICLWANLDTVTGATGGLGYSIAEALLQAEADVIAIDRNEEPINQTWGKDPKGTHRQRMRADFAYS